MLFQTMLLLFIGLGLFGDAQAMEKRKFQEEPEAAAQASSSSSSEELLPEAAAESSTEPVATAESSSKKQKISESNDPLCQAILKQDQKRIDELLATSALDKRDNQGLTPLLYTVFVGDSTTVTKLQQRGAPFSEIEAIQACILACARGHLNLLEALDKKNPKIVREHTALSFLQKFSPIDVQEIDFNHRLTPATTITCLMAAVFFGHEDVVDYLLACKVNANATSLARYTPLQIALAKKYTAIAKKLLEHIKTLREEAVLKHLEWALTFEQYEIAAILIEKFIKPLANMSKTATGIPVADFMQRALMPATKKGHIPTINQLQALYSSPQEADTIIFVHCTTTEVLENVLARGNVDLNARYYFNGKDHEADTPLEFIIKKLDQPWTNATVESFDKQLKLLFQHGAQSTPQLFNTAVFKRHFALARLFLQHGANINARSINERTVLEHLCICETTEQHAGHYREAISFLIAQGAVLPSSFLAKDAYVPQVQNDFLREVLTSEIQRRIERLFKACKEGDCDTIRYCITVLGMPINVTEQPLAEMTPQGIRRIEKTPENHNPLECAIKYKQSEAVKVLLQLGGMASLQLVLKTPSASNILRYLYENNDEKTLDVLITFCTNNADQGKEVLNIMLIFGALNNWLVQKLLHAGADANFNKVGATALMVAAQAGDAQCVRLLLEHHADPHYKNTLKNSAFYNQTALDVAKSAEIRTLLEEAAASVNGQIEHFLNSINNGFVSRELVPGDVNMCDNDGRPLLVCSVQRGNQGAANILLDDVQIDVNKTDRSKKTALVQAAERGNAAMVALLLTRCLKHSEESLLSAAEQAALPGYEAIVDALIAYPLKLAEPAQQAKLRAKLFRASLQAAIAGNQELLVRNLLRKYIQLFHNIYNEPHMHNPMRPNDPPLLLELACKSKNKRLVELIMNVLDTIQNPTLAHHGRAAKDLHRARLESVTAGRLDIFSLLARRKCAPTFFTEGVVQQPPAAIIPVLHAESFPELATNALREGMITTESTLKKRCLTEALRANTLKSIHIFAQKLSHLIPEFERMYVQEYKTAFQKGSIEEKQKAYKKFMDETIEIAKPENPQPGVREKPKLLAIPARLFLINACILGRVDIVEKLLSLGLPRKFINYQDEFGKTALMYALIFGNLDCAFKLIHDPLLDEKGQHICDTKGDGIYRNHCGLAGMNLKDSERNTALYYAAQAGTYDVPALGHLKPGSETYDILPVGQVGNETERIISRHEYSKSQGAIKVMNELMRCGARIMAFNKEDMIPRLLQDLSAEENNEIALKILGLHYALDKKNRVKIYS